MKKCVAFVNAGAIYKDDSVLEQVVQRMRGNHLDVSPEVPS